MSVHKRPDNGTWYSSYKDETGKRKTKNFGPGAEGKRRAMKFDERMRQTAPVIPIQEDDATVRYLDQLAQAFINAKKSEGCGVERLRDLASLLEKHFIPVYGNRHISEIRFDEIIGIIGTKFAHAKQVTRNRYMAYLKTMFNFAVDHEFMDKNPLAKWKRPKEKPRELKLTKADLAKIKAEASPHMAWAIDLAYNLGVRTGDSELLSLKWSDVSWETSTVRVYAPKTNTTREVPVSADFLEVLKQKRKEAETEFLVEYKGERVKQTRKAWRRACERAGFKDVPVFYSVRHLFATTLLRAGGDPIAVSRILGHSSTQMTLNQYYHELGDEKRRTIAKLPELKLR